MMIVQKTVDVKIVPPNKKYWEEVLGQKLKIGSVVIIGVDKLQPKSNITVDCICDKCSRKYTQRIYRDTSVCGYCKSSLRMKGNSFGSRNVVYEVPSKEELNDLLIEGGKLSISKKYGVSIPVVNRWLKIHSIDIRKYHGRKYFISEENEVAAVDRIKTYIGSGMSISEISEATLIPRNMISSLKKKYDLKLETKVDAWNRSYQDILDNIEVYVKENNKKTLMQISIDHNISVEQLKKAFKENNIEVKLHSYNKSAGELECRKFIQSLGENCFSSMFDKTFEIDCYIPSKKIGVEYCGEYWHRYVPEKNNKYYHRNKLDFSSSKGIDLMTFFDTEWKNKNSIVTSMISNKLGHSKRIFARKCNVLMIDKKMATYFMNANHISGASNSSVNLGLFHEDVLVSVLSMIKSRFDPSYEWEISRFASLLGHSVVGGLSKLFTHFVKTYNPNSVMTYADLRFGRGTSYEKIGFVLLNRTPPNYYYYNKKYGYLESRMKYQKHKLKTMASYSDDKTEYEIMDQEGYLRVYDCGNNKFGWKRST
jgi:hypothetical protein